MAERRYIEVQFFCDCRVWLEAYLPEGANEDYVHCHCGKEWLVTRPYVVMLDEVAAHQDSKTPTT